MNLEKYHSKDFVLSGKKTLLYGALFSIPFVILFGVLWRFYFLPKDNLALIDISGINFMVTFIVIIIISLIFHELLHGLGWKLVSKTSWRNIKFGGSVKESLQIDLL